MWYLYIQVCNQEWRNLNVRDRRFMSGHLPRCKQGAGLQVLLHPGSGHDVDLPTEHGGILRADSRLGSHFISSKTARTKKSQMLRFDYSSTVLNTNNYLRQRPIRRRFSTPSPTSYRFSASWYRLYRSLVSGVLVLTHVHPHLRGRNLYFLFVSADSTDFTVWRWGVRLWCVM